MDFTNLYNSIANMVPEIVLSATLLIIVLFDLAFSKNKNLLPAISIMGLLITAFFVIRQIGVTTFAFASSEGSQFSLVTIDSFGIYFKLLILLSSILIVLFSLSSEEVKKSFDRLGEYYTLIFGMILGMFFMISASDLILIYISVELLSLSSYVLTGFTKLRSRNSEAALKYIIYGAVSSGLMLFGISLIYGITGSTNLYAINSLIQAPHINLLTFSFACILVFAGIGFKMSAAPFHFWTPDVYEGAPITITAFLSVASKAAGFALLIRLIHTSFVGFIDPDGNWQLIGVFDWQSLLIVISIFTMTLGNFAALWQNNLKRMLAYSSIAHAGYMILGLAVMSNQGLIAILIYFTVYLFMNLGAFYIVMLIADKAGTEDIHEYDGIGNTSAFLGVSLAIFLVSLTGLPPTAGFIGKLYIFIALVNAKMVIVAVIALLNSVVSLYYYIRVLKHLFLVKATSSTPKVVVSNFNTILINLLVIPVLLLGVYFTPMVEFAKYCVQLLGL
ncbi:MAG: NADH-quinone oxidoreductase subunit N [bacterium]